MNVLKRIALFFTTLGMVLGTFSSSAAVFTPETKSESAVLVDLKTGRVLAEKIGGATTYSVGF